MPSTATPAAEPRTRPTSDGPFPFVFDVLAALVVALGGLVFLLAGSVLRFGIDRETLKAAIDSGVTVVALDGVTLTPAASVELASTALTWTGTGLLVVGLAMLGFAGCYVVLRHRTRRRPAGRPGVSDFTAFAVVGSAVAAVLSFLPGSAGLGGLVAGYLDRGDARETAAVGAFSGFLITLPAIVVAVFGVGGVLTGLVGLGFADAAILVAVVGTVVILLATAINVGLGALGGYVGRSFAAD